MKCPGNYERSFQARCHAAVKKWGCKLAKSICRKKRLTLAFTFLLACEGISSSMNFDEEDDDEDEISSSSSQLNSNTRPGSATSKKSCKVKNWQTQTHLTSVNSLIFPTSIYILRTRMWVLAPSSGKKASCKQLNTCLNISEVDCVVMVQLNHTTCKHFSH